MIDLHCHLLPGIDDGPRSMSDAVTMARAAVAAGTTAMVCTPHMHPRFPTRPATVLAGVAALAERLREEDVPLEVYAGGEIALGHLPKMSDADLAMACLGSGSWLLLEMPFRGWPLGLAETVRDLEIRGYRVVLAHPERAESIQRTPDRLRDIVGRGALVQITAESLTGDNGTAARRTAQVLLAGGAAHIIASDAHSAGPWRPPGLTAGLEAAAKSLRVESEALSWMVYEGPAAIVAGRPVKPPRLTPSRRLREDVRPGPGAPRSPTRG